MSLEIEAKFYVRRLAEIARRLELRGAKQIMRRVHETNLRFDLPDGSLRAQGRVLRLRQDENARITYKGSSEQRSGVLVRPEIEFAVSDFHAARKMLEALGYVVAAVYEKYRTTYEAGPLHVMLDELPYGDFVEIEGPEEETVRNAAAGLGLDPSAAIPASYLALFERLCEHHGLDPAQLTFEAIKDLHPGPEQLSVRPADD